MAAHGLRTLHTVTAVRGPHAALPACVFPRGTFLASWSGHGNISGNRKSPIVARHREPQQASCTSHPCHPWHLQLPHAHIHPISRVTISLFGPQPWPPSALGRPVSSLCTWSPARQHPGWALETNLITFRDPIPLPCMALASPSSPVPSSHPAVPVVCFVPLAPLAGKGHEGRARSLLLSSVSQQPLWP